MTDPQTPATEAGRAAMEFLRTRAWLDAILVIEAESRGDDICPDCGLTARHIGQVHITAQRAVGPGHADHIAAIRADERERLAGAVPLLRHAAEYLSGEFGRTGKAEPNVLADRLQTLAALLQPDTAP